LSKPPKSTPHSDIDGIHEDERPNVDSAIDAGEDSSDLGLAHEETTGRPARTDDPSNREDRSR
jgi:hypothetical protein